MIVTLLVVVLAILALLFMSKMKTTGHKFSLAVIIILILFFYFTFTSVASSNSVNLNSTSGIISAGQLYFSWLGHAFTNVKSITGNAVKMDWSPANVTG